MSRYLFFILTICIVIGLSIPSHADYETGVAAYDKGDYKTAFRELKKLAQKGSTRAQYYLGVMYMDGKGVKQDNAEAIKWFKLAAEQSHAASQNNLGVIYYIHEKNELEAIKWFRMAAQNGSPEAQVVLGTKYLNGEGIQKNCKEAEKWIMAAAQSGNVDAQKQLAIMCFNGLCIAQDHIEAAKWFGLSASQGDSQSQFNLGRMYYNGEGVKQDYIEAAKFFRSSAENGHSKAQILLGGMYSAGQGVKEDYDESIRWLKLAASQGETQALYLLGTLYSSEEYHNKDYAEALTWFRKAARQGDVESQLQLGRMYNKGKGVSKNYVEAIKWIQKAADQGNSTAQLLLANSYYLGEGVPQDYVLAFMWINIAAASDPDEKWKDFRNGLADLMTPVQISKAQQMSREWSSKAKPDIAQSESKSSNQVQLASTGSGFFVSNQGHVLTNYHVIDGCSEVRIPPSKEVVAVVASDPSNDIALISSSDLVKTVAQFRDGRGLRVGDSVVVAGFPLRGLLASGVNITTGTVSALAGISNDTRMMQITAPVQPGNSGGPLLDQCGNVVGVVVSKLDAIAIAKASGDIPQNVNFAIHSSIARSFLDAQGIIYQTAISNKKKDTANIGDQARQFTVVVECWKGN